MATLIRFFLRCVTLASILFCNATTVFATAYVPKSDATVLERLPFKPNDPVARELASMRAELQRNPRHLEVAVKLEGTVL